METKSPTESSSSSSSSQFHFSDQDQHNWIQDQESLKNRLITEDDYTWKLEEEEEKDSNNGVESSLLLKHIGGVDISFSKHDPSVACGTLVVLDFDTLNVVYEDSDIVKIDVPYVPGFLGFREAPIFLQLLKKMQKGSHPFYPQLLMIDGNGILHPRGFGSACHLGVLANLPTIGIGKNYLCSHQILKSKHKLEKRLHHVDGLTNSRVRELLEAEENFNVDYIPLLGNSGNTLGAAIHSSKGSFKPIFVSVGHRVSLASAIEVVKRTCKYRVPEPVRQADIRSRDYLRKHH